MINKTLIVITVSVLLIFGIYVGVVNDKIDDVKNKWSVSENNYKASLKKNIAYQLTISQLNKSADSLDIKLSKFKKELNIKDSKINALMIILDSIKNQDSIIFRDTIFVKNLKLDTVLGDRWIKKKLKLRYPGTIIIDEEIYNEKSIVWSNKREIVGDSSKIFFIRWFQPKQTIVEITVKDENPYFKNKEFKYNTIIKK